MAKHTVVTAMGRWLGATFTPDPVGAVGMIRRSERVKERIRMISRFRRGFRFSIFGGLLTLAIGCALLTSPTQQAPAVVDAGSATALATTAPTSTEVKELKEIDQDEKSRVVAELLERKLPEVTFKGVPLSEAIEYLRQQTGAEISVSWKLTLHPEFAMQTAIKQLAWPGRPSGSDLTIEAPQTETHARETTVTVSEKGTVLFYGLTIPANPYAGIPQPRRLLVLATPTLIRNDRK